MHVIIENLQRLQEIESQSKRRSSETESTIAQLRKAIPAPILAHYDRLRERGKKGVSALRNGVCAECHMHVPIGTVATLMQGKDIQLCTSCGRYLYLSQDAPPASVQTKPAKPRRKLKNPTDTSDAQ